MLLIMKLTSVNNNFDEVPLSKKMIERRAECIRNESNDT